MLFSRGNVFFFIGIACTPVSNIVQLRYIAIIFAICNCSASLLADNNFFVVWCPAKRKIFLLSVYQLISRSTLKRTGLSGSRSSCSVLTCWREVMMIITIYIILLLVTSSALLQRFSVVLTHLAFFEDEIERPILA